MGNEGAFAMIDALGYREAVAGDRADQTIDKMVALVEATTRDAAGYAHVGTRFPSMIAVPQATFVSDAVFVGVPLLTQERKREAVETLALFLSLLMDRAAQTEPRLLYRGCVTIGDYAMRNGFVAGGAVSRVAKVAEKAEGAFVWLDARASNALEIHPERPDGPIAGTLVRWSVPLKELGSYQTWVVTPMGIVGPGSGKWIRDACSRFDEAVDQVDVQVKGQNTRAFFLGARKVIERAVPPKVKAEWAAAAAADTDRPDEPNSTSGH